MVLCCIQGRKKQQQQQMQEQQAQDIQDGRPRVFVPGQGWVAIDPDWERQDDAPATNEEGPQARAPEQTQTQPSQDKGQGYDADSETDSSELRGAASDKAEAGSTQAADSDIDVEQRTQSHEERHTSKPVESSYALGQGGETPEDSGHKGEDHDSTERRQRKAGAPEQADLEQADQKHARRENEGKEQKKRHEDREHSEHRQQEEGTAASDTAAGQEQQATAEKSHTSTEQMGEAQQRTSHRGKVRGLSFSSMACFLC